MGVLIVRNTRTGKYGPIGFSVSDKTISLSSDFIPSTSFTDKMSG
ncbi:hypothetical protein [Shewanella nanhaiensis]|nr:hypothetical protein [Shewanella nanhaiensis]